MPAHRFKLPVTVDFSAPRLKPSSTLAYLDVDALAKARSADADIVCGHLTIDTTVND